MRARVDDLLAHFFGVPFTVDLLVCKGGEQFLIILILTCLDFQFCNCCHVPRFLLALISEGVSTVMYMQDY
jgi:hypothetical protein